jgi:thiol:disulfide interchange protein DsbG
MLALPRSLFTGLLAACLAIPGLADDSLPAPVQALTGQGLTIHQSFEAPGGLTGYAASHPGGEVAIYLMPDGEHAIVGTLVDAKGDDLSAQALDEYVRKAQEAEVWQQLEESAWIQDGDTAAPRLLYTFTDPNCPFCRQLHHATRPWVEAGEVQIRHIMVGILEQDSPARAAALLGADDPAAALQAHSSGIEEIAPSPQPRDIEQQVYDNNRLFDALGLIATPSTFARLEGRLERAQGVPHDERLIELMGGPAP